MESKGGNAIPAEPIRIALILTHLLDFGSSFNVISSVKYDIKWLHNILGQSDPADNTFVRHLVEAAKRHANNRTIKKEPITTVMIVQLCIKYRQSSDLLVISDLTMILICFTAFLRLEELSSLKCSNIHFYDIYFSVCIEQSKTDQY